LRGDFWFPPIQLPVLTMICGYSRWLLALLIPTRRAEDLFAGWWHLIQTLGAVPRTLVWDGGGAMDRWHGSALVGREEVVVYLPYAAGEHRPGVALGPLRGVLAKSFPAYGVGKECVERRRPGRLVAGWRKDAG
jgi:hypothetical protein